MSKNIVWGPSCVSGELDVAGSVRKPKLQGRHP